MWGGVHGVTVSAMEEGVRIVLTRWGPATAAVALLVTGALAAGPLWAFVDADTTGERAFLGVVSLAFGLPFLWALWRTPRAMRGMGIAVDSTGLYEFDGGRIETVPWSDVDRVGFGAYSRNHRGLKTRSLPAFEVYRKAQQQPVIRCTLSPYGDAAPRLERAVRQYHPELWAGPFTHDR